jgi:hypothetical protein
MLYTNSKLFSFLSGSFFERKQSKYTTKKKRYHRPLTLFYWVFQKEIGA